jgi:ribosomal protein S18 acetylase RimI-like enzyme
MQFELTEALIDDILFSMEDQEGNFFIDTLEGVVRGGEEFSYHMPDPEPEGEERYISIPEWDSSDGFRLMERFAAQLRNPIIRGELSAALNRGKGVFRGFKDILGRHPETERHWFAYKEREMKREILRWYNGLREEWGLERIGGEPEETGDLILEDFRFRPSLETDREAMANLHRICLSGGKEGGTAGTDFPECSGTVPGEPSFTAETIGGEFAGYISGMRRDSSLYITALEVIPEYRGLGIGETLVARFLEQVDSDSIDRVTIELPAEAEGFSRVLHRNAFRIVSSRYVTLIK